MAAGSELSIMTQMADIAPTMIELAGGTPPTYMDGHSFAKYLTKNGTTKQVADVSSESGAEWRDTVLIEYWSIRPKLTAEAPSQAGLGAAEAEAEVPMHLGTALQALESEDWIEGQANKVWPKHYHDGPNNTFIMTRTINPTTGVSLLYAEFTDVNIAKCWDWASADCVGFYELYNMTDDPFMKHNIYSDVGAEMQQQLHTKLRALYACQGSDGGASACP